MRTKDQGSYSMARAIVLWQAGRAPDQHRGHQGARRSGRAVREVADQFDLMPDEARWPYAYETSARAA